MTRFLRILIAALGLVAVGSTAALAQGRSCHANDRPYPDKSTLCRNGTLWQCENGEWKTLEVKCSY